MFDSYSNDCITFSFPFLKQALSLNVLIAENGRVEQVHGGASGGGELRRGGGEPGRAVRPPGHVQRAHRAAGPNRGPGRAPEGRLPVKDRPQQGRRPLNCYLVATF